MPESDEFISPENLRNRHCLATTFSRLSHPYLYLLLLLCMILMPLSGYLVLSYLYGLNPHDFRNLGEYIINLFGYGFIVEIIIAGCLFVPFALIIFIILFIRCLYSAYTNWKVNREEEEYLRSTHARS